ncbi:hypothetical protein JTE90_020109 [Oedothorax gibbosus]|uniref:Uncharacterized protein n=1 Tax=Oedothorax gibbosus TaxID=931172 RepID=A0AAV6VQS1_9ARAC|nr:hypothetical protein JTE90_020109 [Oedothorax gibbosus]
MVKVLMFICCLVSTAAFTEGKHPISLPVQPPTNQSSKELQPTENIKRDSSKRFGNIRRPTKSHSIRISNIPSQPSTGHHEPVKNHENSTNNFSNIPRLNQKDIIPKKFQLYPRFDSKRIVNKSSVSKSLPVDLIDTDQELVSESSNLNVTYLKIRRPLKILSPNSDRLVYRKKNKSIADKGSFHSHPKTNLFGLESTVKRQDYTPVTKDQWYRAANYKSYPYFYDRVPYNNQYDINYEGLSKTSDNSEWLGKEDEDSKYKDSSVSKEFPISNYGSLGNIQLLQNQLKMQLQKNFNFNDEEDEKYFRSPPNLSPSFERHKIFDSQINAKQEFDFVSPVHSSQMFSTPTNSFNNQPTDKIFNQIQPSFTSAHPQPLQDSHLDNRPYPMQEYLGFPRKLSSDSTETFNDHRSHSGESQFPYNSHETTPNHYPKAPHDSTYMNHNDNQHFTPNQNFNKYSTNEDILAAKVKSVLNPRPENNSPYSNLPSPDERQRHYLPITNQPSSNTDPTDDFNIYGRTTSEKGLIPNPNKYLSEDDILAAKVKAILNPPDEKANPTEMPSLEERQRHYMPITDNPINDDRYMNFKNATVSGRNEDGEDLDSDTESEDTGDSEDGGDSEEAHSGFLDMGAYTDRLGSFGWYADFPVGRGHDKVSYSSS